MQNSTSIKPVLVQKFIPTTGANLSGERFSYAASPPLGNRTGEKTPRTPFQRLPTLFFLARGTPIQTKELRFLFQGVPLAEKTELKLRKGV